MAGTTLKLTTTFTFLHLLLQLSTSISFNYPAVFNFGDSNSDTGELTAGLGFHLNPPYGQTFFKAPAGRFSDGRLIIDFLMEAMGMPYLKPYLSSVGSPRFKYGCNFAAGGSTMRPATPSSISPFSFDVQISQFLNFKSQVLQLLSRDRSLGQYLPSEDYFLKGLYMFDIGQNDISGAFYSKDLNQVLASIPSILQQFEDGLKKLYWQGARNFWIHNTGPLGCLAQIITRFGTEPSKLDWVGCVWSHNQAAMLFNLQLHALCSKLKTMLPGSNITYIDIYPIKFDLIKNYAQYGFEHALKVCCGAGGPRLNYNDNVQCGKTVALNQTAYITAGACQNSSRYVNWDGVHYTEAANKFVVSQILSGRYSDPGLPEKRVLPHVPRT